MSDLIQGFALSPRQKRLWLQQGESAAFRCQCAVGLDGDLDREGLRQALLAAAERHGILRTTFRRRPGVRIPLQVVGESGALDWRELDLGGGDLREILAEERARPFDWENGPVLRATLVALAPRRHALVLTLPALCGDVRTLANLLGEIAGEQPEEPVQYVEAAAWLAGLAEEEGAEEAIARWRRPELAPSPELPWERRPASGDFQLAEVTEDLGRETAARLEEVAAQCQASPGVVLLAAWQALLWRLHRQEQMVVDVVLDGRRFDEFHPGMGPFAGAVPVVGRPAAGQRFSALLRDLEGAVAEAAEGQEHWPLASADADRRPVGFELESWPLPEAFTLLGRHVCAEPFRLKLACRLGAEGLVTGVQYDTRAFEAGEARRFAEGFRALLTAALADPGATLDRLPVLPAEERRRLVEGFNETVRDYPRDLGVHRLFEARAASAPEAVAAESAGQELTYAELNARANRLAHWLRKVGIGPDRLAAVCILDPLEMLTALLGVLKAGGAYLPLDPTYPRERLAFLLRDSGAGVLLTQGDLLSTLPHDEVRTFCLDADGPAIAGESAANPDGGAGPDNLAYVLYTSGSTGRPKGVLVPHRGLTNYLTWAAEAYGAADGDGAPVHSPIGFDLTVTALFPPLLAGRRVVFVPAERGIEALGSALLEREGFSLIKLTPAHLALLGRWLPGEGLARRARALVVGGEALLGEELAFWREHAPETRIFNEYGPTETVVGCSVYEVPPGPAAPGPVPIGRPIANARLYLLDPGLEPVPAGLPGEVFVGGDGVARGYLGRPELTAERFVPDPFAGEPGGRLYRTGDLARLRPDGELEFAGRADRQVKLRGFRIELGEIEAVLARHPEVAAGVAAVREDTPGEKRLVAYVVPVAHPGPSVSELFGHLRRELPEPMIPAAFVTLAELPLDAHGKVDRRALPRPAALRPVLEVGFAAPETELERVIGEVWRESLRLDEVGIHDNFFDLGGDSFLMFQVHRGVAGVLGREFPVMRMFQHPTIHSLAGYLAQEDDDPSLAPSQARAESRRASMQEQRRRRGKGRDLSGVSG